MFLKYFSASGQMAPNSIVPSAKRRSQKRYFQLLLRLAAIQVPVILQAVQRVAQPEPYNLAGLDVHVDWREIALLETESRGRTMVNNFSEEYIRREIGNVMHPTIHCSLVELGIVKNIEIKSEKVIITMALPFAEVPDSIKNYLEDSLREAIEEVDTAVEIQTEVMNKEELKKFLVLEKEKGKSKH